MACRFSGVESGPQKWKPEIPTTRQPGNSPDTTFSDSCWMTLLLRMKTLANTQSVSEADRISCTEKMWGLNQNFSFSFNSLILFIFQINFSWSIIALQCCVTLSCTAKCISCVDMHPLFPGLPSYCNHQSTLSRVPYTVASHWLSIYTVVYPCQPQSPSSSQSLFPPALVSTLFFSASVSLFLLCR